MSATSTSNPKSLTLESRNRDATQRKIRLTSSHPLLHGPHAPNRVTGSCLDHMFIRVAEGDGLFCLGLVGKGLATEVVESLMAASLAYRAVLPSAMVG